MRLKPFGKWLGLAALLTLSSAMAATKPSSTSAEFYKLHPEAYADKEITLEVCFLRAFDRKSPVPELRFLHAVTYDTKNNAFGGTIVLAVPTDSVDKLIKKYGSFPEGGRRWNQESAKLKGTFRIGVRGHYYVDIDGKAAALLNGRDIPDEMSPGFQDGQGGPGRGPGHGNRPGGGGGPQAPQPTNP